jgi:hypothetical protein
MERWLLSMWAPPGDANWYLCRKPLQITLAAQRIGRPVKYTTIRRGCSDDA